MRSQRFLSLHITGFLLPLFLALSISASAVAGPSLSRVKLGRADERKGAQAQADKLAELSTTLEMREGKLTPDAPAGTIDKNSGNPSQSPTTLHTYVKSVCLEWLNPQRCKSWLDPFAPEHGLDKKSPDFSPLEGLVSNKWMQTKNINGGGMYRYWEIRRLGDSGGSNLNSEGALDLSGVTQWNVTEPFSQEIRGLARDTAARVMLSTYDKTSGKGGNVMPNRTALSAIGLGFTKMMRNRMVTNLGEMRAATPPSESLLSEEVPDCGAYKAAVEAAMMKTPGYEKKLPYQAKLNPQSLGSLQSRLAACQAAREASVQAINPRNGQSGDVEYEPIDQDLTRLNIAAIDRVGINVTELPKPSYVQLTEAQVTSESVDFEEGGMSIRGVNRESNAATLNGFNNNLEAAAQKMKNIVLRNPQMVDNGDQIRSFKIEPGTKSATEINGLSGEMKRDLASTSLASAPIMQNPVEAPQTLQEDRPSELTITRQ